jgi:hypothetical protein
MAFDDENIPAYEEDSMFFADDMLPALDDPFADLDVSLPEESFSRDQLSFAGAQSTHPGDFDIQSPTSPVSTAAPVQLFHLGQSVSPAVKIGKADQRVKLKQKTFIPRKIQRVIVS